MILVDSNVLMYAAGAEDTTKLACVRVLDRIARGEIEAAVDAEMLQEILHRYRAIRRWSEGQQVYDMTRRVFPLVISITAEIVDLSRGILDDHQGLTARDALHAAVVEFHDLEAICSYDRDFDRLETIRRIEPGEPWQVAERPPRFRARRPAFR